MRHTKEAKTKMREAMLGNKHALKHGHCLDGKFSPTYTSWYGMLRRLKVGPVLYRELTVSERWRDFKNFLSDMGVRPEGHTLDRINTEEGYSHENCRWATPTVQARNSRLRKDNKSSGVRGVKRNQKNWQANIVVRCKSIYLGTYDTIEEATAARKAGELKYWGDGR